MNKDKLVNLLKSKPAFIMYGLVIGLMMGSIIFATSSSDKMKITGYDELRTDYETLSSQTEGWISLSEDEKKIKAEIANQEATKLEGDKLAREKAESDKLLEEQRKATEGIVVYEDELVKINFLKATASGVEFLAENKTNVNITFQADSIAVNGLSTNNITMSDDVMAQSKGIIEARCSIADTNVSTISGQLRVIDFNDSFDTYDAPFVNVVIN